MVDINYRVELSSWLNLISSTFTPRLHPYRFHSRPGDTFCNAYLYFSSAIERSLGIIVTLTGVCDLRCDDMRALQLCQRTTVCPPFIEAPPLRTLLRSPSTDQPRGSTTRRRKPKSYIIRSFTFTCKTKSCSELQITMRISWKIYEINANGRNRYV